MDNYPGRQLFNNNDSISDIQIFLFNSGTSHGRCRTDVAQLRFRKSKYERELETRRRDQGHEFRGRDKARQAVDQYGMRCAVANSSVQIVGFVERWRRALSNASSGKRRADSSIRIVTFGTRRSTEVDTLFSSANGRHRRSLHLETTAPDAKSCKPRAEFGTRGN